MKIAVIGCTGNLGSSIVKCILSRSDVELGAVVARKGNPHVGKEISELLGGTCDLKIIDEITEAKECDIFIDCTSADAFMTSSCEKYIALKKPLVIATTAFTSDDIARIKELSLQMPVFMAGNFSVALHDFIETLKFAAKRISKDTDVQIVEYHHNQKKDAPSGTALMIRDALVAVNSNLNAEAINICSIRGGNIFGEHEVIFANCKDEVITFKHQVSSRETFADGAVEISCWLVNQKNGMYNMDDFCNK